MANGDATLRRVVYDDAIVRAFALATMVWGAVGILLGVVVATQLSFWQTNFGPWLNFGRLRPLHTNAVIFAFVGNVMFCGIYYSTQRLLKVRLASDLLSRIHFWGWQLIIVAAAVTLPLGLTHEQGVRRADLADRHRHRRGLGRLRVNFFWTIARRNEQHLYVAHLVLHRHDRHDRRAAHRQQPAAARSASCRATRSTPACRTPWCSGGTATTPSPSS